MQTTYSYNPWSRSDKKRLYVNTADGDKIGYLDLSSLDTHPESPELEDELSHALALISGEALDNEPVPPAPSTPEPAAAAAATHIMPWFDLALNSPGSAIADLRDTSYQQGVAGEQRTAGVLAGLQNHGYRILHSIPLSPRKDIDHLAVGPTGIHAINSKAVSYPVTARADGAVFSDGYRQKWLESIERDAAVASEYLSTAARMELDCTPVAAVWSSSGVDSRHGGVVPGEALAATILSRNNLYPASWVDVVFSVARRSDTWTAHH